MTKRVLMHVGLGKTGTSTIQATLAAHRGHLERIGAAYPGHGPAHHDLLALTHQAGPSHFWFTNRSLSTSDAMAAGRDAMDALDAAITRKTDTILLSSEYFQTLNAERLAELERRLAERGYGFSVLCVIREPVAHVASRVQQAVKMGKNTLVGAFGQPYQPWAKRFLSEALRALPPRNIHVLKFEEAKDRGLTRSMLTVAGLSAQAGTFDDLRKNTGLCSDAVYLVDAINRADAPGRPLLGRHFRGIRKMQGARFALPHNVAARIIHESRNEQEWLKRNFGLHYPSPDANLGPEASERMQWAEAELARLIQKGPGAQGLPRQSQARSG